MKHVQKTKIPRNLYLTAILLAVFFALTAVLVVINLVSAALKDETGAQLSEIPEIIDGEARQDGLALAYPSINRKEYINFIAIKNQTGEFGFMMIEGDNYHTLYYVEDGQPKIFYPEILAVEPTFDYSQLFAIDTTDGFGRFTLVDYLCLALQSPYFDERIPFETDPAKKELQMKEFGFEDGKYGSVTFSYTDELGNTVQRSVKIGEKSVTGTGYYFIVYDNDTERPYIYSSLNNYYDYAVSNISKFVKPLLVAEGLEEDSGYGPFLTTGYYQWLNKVHDGSCECDKNTCPCRGKCDEADCTCGAECRVTEVTDSSRVIAYVDTLNSVLTDSTESSGIENTGYDVIELDLRAYQDVLKKLKENKNFVPNYESRNYERLIKALTGRKLGEQADEIIATIFYYRNLIDFADSDTVRYEYTITSVDAIITDGVDIVASGASAGASYNTLKVTYTAKLDGKEVAPHALHAVIDLTAPIFDSATQSSLRNAKIGETLNISFTADYTESNSQVVSSKYVITEIIDIFDQDGKEEEKVGEDSIVGYRYKVIIDGADAGEATYWIDLSKVTDGADLTLKNKLKGKSLGYQEIELEDRKAYYQHFADFTTYKISRIDYFVTSELVTAFKFQNSSERDPYYGESLYENLLEDERSLYGLSAGVCETVVKILGGLSDESSTATAAGLSGDKALAVGLTPEVMKKYGLYAHTIYFELPRGIKVVDNGKGENELDDYTHRTTLGFTLYVSEVDPETNMRYIASDLYEVVTRVPAKDFVFLKYDFESFWTRNNLLMLDIAHVDKLGIEFNMSDLKGGYLFDLTQPKNEDDALGVFVTSYGECTPNKFTEFVSNPNNEKYTVDGGVSLKVLFEHLCDATPEEHGAVLPDSLGSASFRTLMKMIYFTDYVDILPDEYRASAPDPSSSIMKITLEIDDSVPNASPYTYVYHFYRIDDRRVRVSIHQENSEGTAVTAAVSDFYISTFAFKKIARNFVSLLNAEVPDTEIGYPDDLK